MALGHFTAKNSIFSIYIFKISQKGQTIQWDYRDFLSWKIYHQITFHAMDYIVDEKLHSGTASEILKKVFFKMAIYIVQIFLDIFLEKKKFNIYMYNK